MNAWVVHQPGPIDSGPLQRLEREVPKPLGRQIRVQIRCCGVCRTDLHLAEGDLLPKRPDVTPGHEVVGVVDALGETASRFAVGDRVGVAWLGGTDGSCRFCRRGAENLCTAPTFTGWDTDGGYADFCVVDEAFGYALPAGIDDEHLAPLLCAGVTADYSLSDDGSINVLNRCRKPDGTIDDARGRAKIVDPSGAKLKVSFFGPFYGDYWVLDHADDYSWSIVGEPSGRYLWLLARQPTPPEADVSKLIERARSMGYDTSMLLRTVQP